MRGVLGVYLAVRDANAMKLSCLPVSYFSQIVEGRMSVGDWAEEGRDLGLDAIDISVLFVQHKDRAELAAMREAVRSASMSIAVATTYPDFTHPEQGRRKAELLQFQRDLEALAALGTRFVRVTAGQAHPETGRRDGLRWALQGINASVETAARLGIRLVFENHAKPGVWRYADFAFPPEIFLEMARELRDTPVGILFDTANPIAYGEDPQPLLGKVIEQVMCLHVSDTGVRGRLEPVVIGTGLVPFPELFAILREKRYDGWFSIEEASKTGGQGVKTAVQFMRRDWGL